jgi:SIR2-like domain
VIDPLTQAAFAVHSNRGAYALLLGSGLSRGAGIKTGYEIVLDLADQVAQLSGEDPSGDREAWYRTKFGEDLDYSRLLERLGATPAERQAILRHYFEPTPEERDSGEKQPTAAHRAIASLVAAGYIRVIITTNFDALLEDALVEAGIRPYVVRGAPDVEGMGPPSQQPCLVVKVHGDYLDTRIRNTPAELDTYDPAVDKLLDRLLDDYGLIVCGWSSDWDGALRDAVRRIPQRRLTTFWTVRGGPSPAASALIANRSAVTITIRDADQFFAGLAERVGAIEDLRQRPPVTVELAVAAAKRHLVDPSGRIRLRDLVKTETDAVLATIASLGDDNGVFSVDEFERRPSLRGVHGQARRRRRDGVLLGGRGAAWRVGRGPPATRQPRPRQRPGGLLPASRLSLDDLSVRGCRRGDRRRTRRDAGGAPPGSGPSTRPRGARSGRSRDEPFVAARRDGTAPEGA